MVIDFQAKTLQVGVGIKGKRQVHEGSPTNS